MYLAGSVFMMRLGRGLTARKRQSGCNEPYGPALTQGPSELVTVINFHKSPMAIIHFNHHYGLNGRFDSIRLKEIHGIKE